MLSQAHPKIMQFIKMTGNENRVICSSYTLMTELSLLQVMCNQVQGLTRVGSQLSSTLFASLHTCLCLYSMSPSSLKSMAQKRLIIIPLPIKWSEIVMKDTFSIAGCKSSCKSKKASEKCCWCCKLNRHRCNLKTYMEQWKVWWGAFITIAWGHGMDLKLFLCDYTCLQHSRQCWTLVRKDVQVLVSLECCNLQGLQTESPLLKFPECCFAELCCPKATAGLLNWTIWECFCWPRAFSLPDVVKLFSCTH